MMTTRGFVMGAFSTKQSVRKRREWKPQIPTPNPRETPKLNIQIWNLGFEDSLGFGAWDLAFAAVVALKERICDSDRGHYLSRLMPKPISRSKTRKAVAKRFKITGTGKVLRSQSSRRHLLSAKNAKRKRHLGKMARVHKTDEARVKANLPFG
jgi:large subunit ribosomal protein L35